MLFACFAKYDATLHFLIFPSGKKAEKQTHALSSLNKWPDVLNI